MPLCQSSITYIIIGSKIKDYNNSPALPGITFIVWRKEIPKVEISVGWLLDLGKTGESGYSGLMGT